jgi:DNA processing protein
LAGGGIAVVGSRRMSAYGRQVASELGGGLARAGESVVSGLARGVDGAAQQAALKAGGHTAGVLGCGLDVAYPPEHATLMQEVAERGAIISEYPLGAQPLAAHFPARNRIISGLCRAVVVVEAGIKSGSLITARHALDQGREVLAVPGPVTSASSQGCHQLLKQGARVYTSLEDLLAQGSLPPMVAEPMDSPPPLDLPPEAARLLDMIPPTGIHIDELARTAGLKPQEVSAWMVNLELAEVVQEVPGKRFLRL